MRGSSPIGARLLGAGFLGARLLRCRLAGLAGLAGLARLARLARLLCHSLLCGLWLGAGLLGRSFLFG